MKEMYEVLRLNKYTRDGLRPRIANVEACNDYRMSGLIEKTSKYEPVNLTDQTMEQALVSLCSRGPSFVPTPTNVDWNDLQRSWLDFKRNE
jgi:hypothetical protein